MNNEHDVWTCTECGHTATNRFIGDICPRCGMTYWRCSECGFTFVAAAPPDLCPECSVPCEFVNITCYIPGWRESETVNPDFFVG
jgi:rubrerythrin